MNQNNVKFFYIRHHDNRPLITIGYRWNPGDPYAAYAVAYCSPKDTVSKSKGRSLVLERLALNPQLVYVPKKEVSYEIFFGSHQTYLSNVVGAAIDHELNVGSIPRSILKEGLIFSKYYNNYAQSDRW